MNYTEFSKQIKEKYPYYKNVDDRELAQKIVEKYPYYKDKVTFYDNENKTTVGEVVKNMFAPVTEAVSNVADFASVKPYNNNVTEKKQPELRARTAQDDNAKVIYEPNGFDILGEKIAVASATDKGATTTKDLEDIKKKQNFAMMTAGVVPFVAGGQMSVGGLVILESIQQAKNYFASKIKGKNYDFMAYENLSSLLPDNTPSVIRVVSSLAEMVTDCVVAGKVESAGVKFLVNEAVNRLENRMIKAGYDEAQTKTATDNLKKKIVERVTGLREKDGQITKTEPKPINIDEAAKLNVGVEKVKIPEAPKKPVKADVDIEEIKEPVKIENNADVDIKKKWDNAKKYEGNSDIIPVGDNAVEGKFVLVEADSPTPSHNPNANFQMTKGFPTTKEGKTVNDRDYFNDKQAQAIVLDTANKYDFRAVKDVPVVSKDGIVLSGNQRTMAGQLAAKKGTDTNYIDYLKEHSQQYGFTKEQIAEFKNPRLVFVPNQDIEYTTQNFALFNAQDKKSQSAIETAVSLGKRINEDTIQQISGIFDKFETMSEFNSSPADIKEIRDILTSNNIINKNDLAKYFETSSTGSLQLSEVGKDFVENLLLGTAIKEQALRDLSFIKNIRAKLLKNLLPLLENRSLPEEYQLQNDVEKAVRLLVAAKQSGVKTITDYLSQMDFFQEESFTPEQIKLAQLLQQEYKNIKSTLTSYNSQAADNVNYGQGDLLSGGKQQTKEEILNGIFKNNKGIKDIEFVEPEENNNVSASKTDFSQNIRIQLPKVTKTHNELIKKSEIIDQLAKDVDLPVRIGGTGRRNILGLYYSKEEMVRLKVANDMLTLAHEIGHHEEKVLFGGVARKYKDFTPEEKEFFVELKPLATKPKGNETRGKVFSEGLAQFISMFVNNPAQAQAVAPKFYKFFTEQAPIKTPIQYEALKKAQAQMSKYYSQNATNTVKSHISFKEESPKLTVKEKFDNITESIRTQLFDRLEPLRQAVRKTYQKAGMEISDTEVNNPYFLARLYSGAVGRAEVFLNKHTYDFKTLQKTGKALGDIIKDIHNKGGNLEDFASYLVAHDTIELAKRNINSGVELAAAKETVNLLKPIYDSYAQELYQYRLSLLKMLKDGQVITDEAYNNIINAGERYAPLQRVLDDKVIKTVGGRNFKSKNPLKSIKGSGRDIINPLETIVEDTYNVIKLVEKNRVGLALAKLSRLDKSGAFVFGPIHKTKTVRDIEGNEAIGSDYTIDENNEIKVFVNGKPQIYEVDKSIAKIMNGLTLSNQILYSQTLEAVATLPAKMLKFGATDVNVAFAFKNILRDLPVALVSTENKFSVISENVLKLTVLGLKALTNEKARLEWNEIADQMNKAGGGQSLLINDNRDSTIKAIDDLNYSGYLDKIWNKVKERDFIEAAKTGIIGTTEAVRALVGFLEQVPRMAEFVSSLEGKPLTKENLEQAGFNARKITLDFASGGNLAKWINKYVPYENAFFLGIGKIAEVIKTPKMFKRLLGVLVAYAIINVLGRLINGDDEEVNDVNRTQKYTNFVFKIGDTIYRIPKTIELAPFYTTIDTAINAIFDTIKGTKTDKKEYLKDIYGSIEANLVPNVLPQVAKLPLELYANKSMFFKTPIVSAELEKVLPEYQYTEYTTELAKFIANTLGNIGINKGLIAATIGSPQRLEYIVNSLTGNTGKYLFEKADQIGRATGVLPDKEYELPEKTLADIPFARVFVIRYPAQSRSIQEFYEKYKEMKRYEDTFKLAKKRADIDTVKEMAIYQSVNKVSKISKSMSDIRKVILETYTNKDMNKNEKRQTIDELMLTRLALAKQGLNVMKEIEENIKEEK